MTPPSGSDHAAIPDDSLWLSAAEEGEQAAGVASGQGAHSLECLYRRHSSRLLRFLSRRVPAGVEASDLLQEVFCRIARRPHLVGEMEQPEAYLTRVASNLLRDRAKAATTRYVHLPVEADDVFLAGPDPLAQLESRDILERLEAAMLKLKPKTRQIFLAHRLDGLSYAEIAERTGLSVKGVEKQMSKAIAQIDRSLHRR